MTTRDRDHTGEPAGQTAEQQLQSIAETAQDAIFCKDAMRRYTFVNPAGARFIGRPAAEILGRTPEELYDDAGARTVAEVDNRNLAGEVVDVVRTMELDGHKRALHTIQVPMRDEDGRIVGISGIVRDVTALQQARDALSESEQRYRGIFESATDGLLIFDRLGVIREANPAACAIHGYAHDDLVGRPGREIVHPDSRHLFEQYLVDVGAGRSFSAVARDLHRDGSPIEVEVSGGPFRLAGDTMTLGIVRDVTDRRRMEQHLSQTQKMEALGRLAGGVAHDLNNLLTAITGFSDLILVDLPADDPAREQLEQIRAAGQRGSALTRQLLAFSHHQVLRLRTLDLNLVVKGIRPMLGRLIGEDIELVIDLSRERALIEADATQVDQVLMNLVINARQAMAGGGTLSIETGLVEIGSTARMDLDGVAPGRYVTLCVRDTGVGMTDEVRRRAFEPFFTTRQHGEGSGLGLSIVHGVVHQSGGAIRVTSTPGVGTTVEILLPHTPTAAEHIEPSIDVVRPVEGNEAVLLVEDDPLVRQYVRQALAGFGYEVLEAANGREALMIAERRQLPIHLVLTDVVLPGMSGRELAEALVTRRPDLKVLYMSGYGDDEVMLRGVSRKRAAFLSKPFTIAALTQKVRQVLDDAPRDPSTAAP